MAYTIGSDTYTATSPQHPTVHNNITDVLIGMGAVYNVLNTAYSGGAKGNGVADDYAAIQAALTACRTSTYGGVVIVPPGIYLASQILQIGSNTALIGAGIGVTTIKADWGIGGPTQVGSIPAPAVLTTYGYTTCSNILVSGITFDGNQSAMTSSHIPSWAAGALPAPVLLNACTNLALDRIEVINAINYSVWLLACVHFWVTNSRIISGQTPATGYNQQDGIHITGCQYGMISNNDVDTGTTNGAGDDGIALQSLSTGLGTGACTDIVVSGNRVRSAANGINLVIGGGTVTNIEITGNDIWGTLQCGMVLTIDQPGGTITSNVSITGNVMSNVCGMGNSIIVLMDYTAISSTGAGWADVAIIGNTINSVSGSSTTGIYAGKGTGLTISGNVFDSVNIQTGMQIGNTSSNGVTDFQVSNNVVNMSTSTVTGAAGIAIIDSQDGVVAGNVVIGPGTANTTSIGINPYSDASGAIVSGVAATGNRVTAWHGAITETNAGGQPDYNIYVGNNCHGCTTFITTSGSHDVVASNLVA